MRTHQHITPLVIAMAILFTTLALLRPSLVNGETKVERFLFGGPGRTSTDATVSLSVPARTSVKIRGVLNPTSGLPVSVVIDVFRPGISSEAAASLPWITAPTPIPFEFGAETLTGGFTSLVGCPSNWRVRVRTADGRVPAVPVSGSVTFDFQKPSPVNLDMVGDSVSVNISGTKKVDLAGHDALGFANLTLIAGTGQFRIKAKWDTDPSDPWHIGQFFKVRVALLRPNGTLAKKQKAAFSQHRPGNATKVNFTYNVTQADAALKGNWQVRISNTARTGGGRVKITNFDVENLVFPTFNSTFQSLCHQAE